MKPLKLLESHLVVLENNPQSCAPAGPSVRFLLECSSPALALTSHFTSLSDSHCGQFCLLLCPSCYSEPPELMVSVTSPSLKILDPRDWLGRVLQGHHQSCPSKPLSITLSFDFLIPGGGSHLLRDTSWCLVRIECPSPL